MTCTLIAELFRAIDTRDWMALKEIFDPDIVYERPNYRPCAGIAQLLHFYQHERVIAAGEHRIEQIVIQDDHGVCWRRFVGVTKDGAPADELFADVYIFERGKIKMRRSYFFRPAIYSFSEKELDLFTRSSRCGIVPHSSADQKMWGSLPHLRQKIQIFI
jgi:ketosteroid isomerase-like protein